MADELLLLPPKALTPALHRWGTVTQASPLRVQLDGDDAPLLSDPWDLAGPRVAGERVYCQIANRRVTIIGPSTTPHEPEDLTSCLDTTLWEPYSTSYGAALLGYRWGPMIMLRGVVKPKTGNPFIGTSGPSNTTQRLATGVPERFRMRKHSDVAANVGYPRQQMTGAGGWYAYPEDGDIYAERINPTTTVSTSTWFPFGLWGWALDAF